MDRGVELFRTLALKSNTRGLSFHLLQKNVERNHLNRAQTGLWQKRKKSAWTKVGVRKGGKQDDGEFEGSAGSIGLDDHDLVAGQAGLSLKGQAGVEMPAFSKLPHTSPFLFPG